VISNAESAETSVIAPRLEAMTEADLGRRATTVLDILRRLDVASLDEVLVIERALGRIEVMRREGPRLGSDARCVLDEALLLEFTDIRLDREAPETAKLLRESDVSSGDRALVLNAVGSIAAALAGKPPQRTPRQRLADAARRHGITKTACGCKWERRDGYGDVVVQQCDEHKALAESDLAREAYAAADADQRDRAMRRSRMCTSPGHAGPVTLHEGDSTWHDGPGWYYTIDDYPDEGSCGAFPSRILAEQHARMVGHTVEIEGPTAVDMIDYPDPIDGDNEEIAIEGPCHHIYEGGSCHVCGRDEPVGLEDFIVGGEG
jgi:hypothetical protein